MRGTPYRLKDQAKDAAQLLLVDHAVAVEIEAPHILSGPLAAMKPRHEARHLLQTQRAGPLRILDLEDVLQHGLHVRLVQLVHLKHRREAAHLRRKAPRTIIY